MRIVEELRNEILAAVSYLNIYLTEEDLKDLMARGTVKQGYIERYPMIIRVGREPGENTDILKNQNDQKTEAGTKTDQM